MNGLDMMLKTFGFDAAEMKNSVMQFRELVLRLALSVERVEAQQRALMTHMGLEISTMERQHGNANGQDNPTGIVNTSAEIVSTAAGSTGG